MTDYRNMIETVEDDMEHDRHEKAQIVALLAIADRLDRLCEIMSSRKDRW